MKSLSHLAAEFGNEAQSCGTEDAKIFYCYRLEPVRCIIIIIIIIIKPTSTKPQAGKIRLDIQNYGCSGNLLSDHGVAERNCIFSLQSHGKALEKECCPPGVFCDSGDTPACACP